MGDNPQAASLAQGAPSPAFAAAPAKRGFALPAKISGAFARHPGVGMAVIVVLTVVIVGMFVRGRGGLRGLRKKKPGKAPMAAAKTAGKAEAGPEPEVDALVNAINAP